MLFYSTRGDDLRGANGSGMMIGGGRGRQRQHQQVRHMLIQGQQSYDDDWRSDDEKRIGVYGSLASPHRPHPRQEVPPRGPRGPLLAPVPGIIYIPQDSSDDDDDDKLEVGTTSSLRSHSFHFISVGPILVLGIIMFVVVVVYLVGELSPPPVVTQVALGKFRTCFIRTVTTAAAEATAEEEENEKTAGFTTTTSELMCMGQGDYENRDVVDRRNDHRHYYPTTATLVGNEYAIDVAVGAIWHTCVITDYGNLECWGMGAYYSESYYIGGGGKTSMSNTATPTTIDVGGQVKQVALASSPYTHYTCAVLVDCTLKCWGDNRYGQLGTGDKIDRATPTTIHTVGGKVQQIALGGYHSCVVLVDGILRCWGHNNFGQLGTGDTLNRSTPTTIAVGGPVKQIALGVFHSCAVLVDNNLQCWGDNSFGQLGLGDASSRFVTPTTIIPIGNLKQIALGWFHTCAVVVDGKLWCWGQNFSGELGLGDTSSRFAPTIVTGVGGQVKQIDLGNEHSCAVLVNGNLQCWGYNCYGQLGTGDAINRSTPTTIIY